VEIREAIERLEGAKDFNFFGRQKVCEAIDIALDRLSKTCLTCKRWKAFADAMECTRCHEERSSDEYCSKWENKYEDEGLNKDK